MTTSDIIHILTLVAGTQLACDLIAWKFIYSKEAYHRAVASFHRAKVKRDKILNPENNNNSNPNNKNKNINKTNTSNAKQSNRSANAEAKAAKKIQRAEDDVKEAAAVIATRHTSPSMFTSVAFIILYRILSTEYSGKVVAVLPFQPTWGLVRRLTMKGIQFQNNDMVMAGLAGSEKVKDSTQACSFLFIYILSTLSVKFILNKLVGVQPPKGADKGVSTLLDAPQSQRALEALGVDTEELNEVRKSF